MIGDNETFLSTRRHNTRSYARIPLCILRKLGTKAITQNFPRRCKRQSEKRKGGEKKKNQRKSTLHLENQGTRKTTNYVYARAG